jgi:hypothetical protein
MLMTLDRLFNYQVSGESEMEVRKLTFFGRPTNGGFASRNGNPQRCLAKMYLDVFGFVNILY